MPDSIAAAATVSNGRVVPIPDGVEIEDATAMARKAHETLEAERDQLGLPDLKVRPLDEFLAAAEQQKLSREDKERIVDQAFVLIEDLYPHLPFKRRLYNFAHPLETLSGIRGRLDTLGETEFHSLVTIAMNFVVDAHTLYGLPAPYRGTVAFLPFQVRAYRDQEGFPRFVVTKVMNGFVHLLFVEGAEITHWNFNSADFHVENTRGCLPGGNYRTRIARGVVFSTVKPLTYCQPPEKIVATLHYLPPGSARTHALRIPWAVATGMGSRTRLPGSAFSVSACTGETCAAHDVFHREPSREPRLVEAAFGVGSKPFLSPPSSVPPAGAGPANSGPDLLRVSRFSSIFEFQYTGGTGGPNVLDPGLIRDDGRPNARFGYIRIRSFEDSDTDGLVREFQRILGQVMNAKAPDGLILDIRGNPGGNVPAAERMLQMLTPATITPMRFHLANTQAVQQLLRTLRQLDRNRAGLSDAEDVRLDAALVELRPWVDDVEVSAASASVLTTGHPLTPPDRANDTGQVYQGRCALLIDALTYSAGDIFAAGFQDHAIGPVIGVDPNTGGGGANLWSHQDLLEMFDSGPGGPLQKLPEGATLTLAIRRCSRVGLNEGRALEDVGVVADIDYCPSSADELLSGGNGPIRLACKLLGAARSFRIGVRDISSRPGFVDVDLETLNLDSLVFYLNGVKIFSAPVDGGSAQSVALRIPVGAAGTSLVTVEGYVLLPAAGAMEPVLAATTSAVCELAASPS